MLRYLSLIFAAVLILGSVLTAHAGESKYVKLYVMDAKTNSYVTNTTTEVNVFVDFIDTADYIRASGHRTSDETFGIELKDYFVNDMQNNGGTIKMLAAGEFPMQKYTEISNYQGAMNFYLGRFSITPDKVTRFFKGGLVLQFNFIDVNGESIYVSATNPFIQASGNIGIK